MIKRRHRSSEDRKGHLHIETVGGGGEMRTHCRGSDLGQGKDVKEGFGRGTTKPIEGV